MRNISAIGDDIGIAAIGGERIKLRIFQFLKSI